MHPLLLAVLLLDLLALVLLLLAAWTGLRVVTSWDPSSAARLQLELEARAEAASLQGRWALHLALAASGLLVVAVSVELPGLVPGAMCGTGVLQAMEGQGGKALALRLAAVAALWLWLLVDRIDRTQPGSPLAVHAARYLLLAAPLLLVAVQATGRAVLALDLHDPVDCCAAVYDQALGPAHVLAGIGEGWWLLGWLGGGLIVSALGLVVFWRGPGSRRGLSWAFLAVVAWVPLAAVALVRSLSAYHYAVLQHHCPWCLFLGEHHLVGYALFGSLVVVVLEGLGVWLAWRLAFHPAASVCAAAVGRARRSALRLALAAILFLALSGGPALVWRLRHGVWL